MDGTHKETLIQLEALQYPSSLTIDYMEEKIYWCEPTSKIIERMNLDGTDRKILLQQTDNFRFSPYSVAYCNEYIFYTGSSIHDISRVHLDSTIANK